MPTDRPKKVVFDLIPTTLQITNGNGGVETIDHPAYAMMRRIIAENHPMLVEARIVLMWRRDLKPNRDQKLTLGFARILSDREKELIPYDAEIELNHEWWHHPDCPETVKVAILDHELCHIRPVLADKDDPGAGFKKDERGRIVYYCRCHDVEEFHEVVERHGTYKYDVEQMAQVMLARRDDEEIPPSPQTTTTTNPVIVNSPTPGLPPANPG